MGCPVYCMGRLQRRDDPLSAAEQVERLQRLPVGHFPVFRPPRILEIAVFGTDAGVIQPCRYTVRRAYLPVGILQQITHRPVQHPRAPGGKGGGMFAGVQTLAPRLQAHEAHGGIGDKGMERAHRVAAAADAGQDIIGQPPLRRQDLRPRLAPDDALEIPHHRRVRVRPHDAADQVMRGFDIGHPVADGFVDRIFQRPRAGGHRHHFRLQQAHPKHVKGLAADVLLAHINDALQTQHRGGGSGGDPVLSGAGFGDDAPLAHKLRQQRLPQGVVDFMRPGMRQILPLQVNFGAAQMLRQVFGVIQRRRAAYVRCQEAGEPRLEPGVSLDLPVGGLQLRHRRHQRLRDIPPAKSAVTPARVGQGVRRRINHRRIGRRRICRHSHRHPLCCQCAPVGPSV